MLLTTHYLDEAEALADRVGVIARGRLVEVAVPGALGGRETAPAVVSWTEDGVRRSEATATPTAFVRRAGRPVPRRGPRPRGGPAHARGRLPADDRGARHDHHDDPARDVALPSLAVGLPHPRRRWSSRSSSGSASRSSSRWLFPVILLVVFGAVLDYDIGGGVTFTAVLHGRDHRRRHPRRQPAEHGDQHRHRALRRHAEGPGRHADAEERLLRRARSCRSSPSRC